MYDWANSAFQTTIIAAVFPIYYQKVAAAGQPEAVAISRFAWATTLAILIVAIVAPILGAMADYTAIKKRLLGVFLGIGATRDRGDVLDSARRLGVRAGAVRHRQRRRRRQHRVLRIAAAAPGRREGARSRVDGRLCDRLSRRRHAAGDQPADDPEARAVRHSGRGRRDAAGARERRASGGCVFSIPLFRTVPEPPARIEPDERPGDKRCRTGVRRLVRDLPGAAAVPRGVRVPAGVPPLQRRHPDDDPDGDACTGPGSACPRAR